MTAGEPASPEGTPPEAPAVPLLTLREGLPPIVASDAGLADVVSRMASASGPVALDAERASGYRYSARAYLIQLRRQGAGTALVDPTAFADLAALDAALDGAEWILHAATQDLPCLREVGLVPRQLFDTELAARLLGYPRVGLATLVEAIMGQSMRKEHSAVDWSKRPLPEPWLEYAALDVEVLLELRDELGRQLVETGKDEWARQEFAALVDFAPPVRVDPWRRTSGLHKVRGRRAMAAVRELWTARDRLAADRDTTPGRLIPDTAIVAAANALPTSRKALLGTQGFHGRAASRFADEWVAAIRRARELPEAELPPVANRSDGPPQVRAWADRDPVAAARLVRARAGITALSKELDVPAENLLTPDFLRRVLWSPPQVADADLDDAVAAELRRLGARQWQVDLAGPVLTDAIRRPDHPPAGS
ncbi:MAG TPA: HRDC domain-containing protein [Marmoricola sp.]|nr:HRDC domain-containing protein [Marmoricola sp.]